MKLILMPKDCTHAYYLIHMYTTHGYTLMF